MTTEAQKRAQKITCRHAHKINISRAGTADPGRDILIFLTVNYENIVERR